MKTFDFLLCSIKSLWEDSNKFNRQMKKSSLKTLILTIKILVLTFLILTNFSCWKTENAQKPFTKVTTFAGTGEKFGEPFGVAARNGEIFVSDGVQG
jgi:hypothetical protein